MAATVNVTMDLYNLAQLLSDRFARSPYSALRRGEEVNEADAVRAGLDRATVRRWRQALGLKGRRVTWVELWTLCERRRLAGQPAPCSWALCRILAGRLARTGHVVYDGADWRPAKAPVVDQPGPGTRAARARDTLIPSAAAVAKQRRRR